MLYLGVSRDVVVAEFRRLASKQGISPASFLPRTFYTYEVELHSVLDLRSPSSRAAVGLADADR